MSAQGTSNTTKVYRKALEKHFFLLEGEDKSRRGRAGAGAAEVGGSGVRTGGQEQTGKGAKGQAGVSGASRATGHQEGNREKGADRGGSGHTPNAHSRSSSRGCLHRSVRRCGRRGRGRRAARRRRRYEALAHMERQACRRQAPEPGPDTIYRLEMGSGRGRSERQGGQDGSGGCTADNPVADRREGKGRQGRAAKQRRCATASGRARDREPAKWTGRRPGAGQGCRARRKQQEQAQLARCARDPRGGRGAAGKGTREGRTPRSR